MKLDKNPLEQRIAELEEENKSLKYRIGELESKYDAIYKTFVLIKKYYIEGHGRI